MAFLKSSFANAEPHYLSEALGSIANFQIQYMTNFLETCVDIHKLSIDSDQPTTDLFHNGEKIGKPGVSSFFNSSNQCAALSFTVYLCIFLLMSFFAFSYNIHLWNSTFFYVHINNIIKLLIVQQRKYLERSCYRYHRFLVDYF